MSHTPQDQTSNSSSVESYTQTPLLLDHRKSSPAVIRRSVETSSITIHANSTPNLSTYGTTLSLRNCENNNETRDPLDVLILITDIVLIICAVIVAISLLSLIHI